MKEFPINIYQTDKRIIVVAPLPGAEPEDLTITVGSGEIMIKCRIRGINQDRKVFLRCITSQKQA